MRSAGPGISVLMATRDRPELLIDALQSLQAQTFRCWDAWIVDSGQRQPATATVRYFADPRFHYLRSAHGLGECAARNLALKRASGDSVCYLDDDDELPPDSLGLRFEALQHQPPECGMLYANYALKALDESGLRALDSIPAQPAYLTKSYYDALVDRLAPSDRAVYALLKQFNFIRGGTPLVRRKAAMAVGGFDPQLVKYGDYDLWLKIAARYAIHRIDGVVYTYRFHAGCHHRRLGTGLDKRMALRVCERHRIRRSVQWARYRAAIQALWRNNAGMDTQQEIAQ